MASNIKGITIELNGDATGLKRAIDSVNKDLRRTQSELKGVDSLLKFDPGNVDLLRQKQELLSQSVQETSQKLRQLRRVKQEADQAIQNGNEINEKEYQNLVREISSTEQALFRLTKRARDFSKQGFEIDGLNEAENDIGSLVRRMKTFESQAESSINGVESKFRQLATTVENVGAKMKTVGTRMSGFSAALGGAAVAAVEGTEELRRDLARLDNNAQTAGVSIGFMRDQLAYAEAVTGETDSSVEALSNLLAAGFDETNMVQALESISGAATKFSDTLKLEGLADGLQETLATGAAVGPFAELLERSGIALEDFDAGLANAKKSGNELEYVLETMADIGLVDVANQFEKDNQALFDNSEAMSRLRQALAELADTIAPVLTTVVEAITKIVEWFNNLDESTQNAIISIGLVGIAVGPVIGIVGNLLTVFSKVGNFLGPFAENVLKTATGLGKVGSGGTIAATGLGKIPLKASGIVGLMGLIFTGALKANEKLREMGDIDFAELESRVNDIRTSIEGLDEISANGLRLFEESNADITYIEDLRDELLGLIDASGQVADTDKMRAKVISGILNDALGTEISLNGNVIEGAENLKSATDELIEAKRLETFAMANEEGYQKAIQNYQEVRQAIKKTTEELELARQNLEEHLQEKMAEGYTYDEAMDLRSTKGYLDSIYEIQEQLAVLQEQAINAGISLQNYETAMMQASEGNFNAAMDTIAAGTDITNASLEQLQAVYNMIIGMGVPAPVLAEWFRQQRDDIAIIGGEIKMKSQQAGQEAVNGLANGLNSGAPAESMRQTTDRTAAAAGSLPSKLNQAAVQSITSFSFGLNSSMPATSLAATIGKAEGAASGLPSNLAGVGNQAVSSLTGSLSSSAPAGAVGATVDSTVNAANQMPSFFQTVGGQTINDLAAGIAGQAPAATGASTSVASGVRSSIGSADDNAFTIGASVGMGLVSGMRSQLGAVRAMAAQLGAAAANATAAGAQTHSPSKITTEVGKDIAAGLPVGMEYGTAAAVQAAAALGEETADAVAEVVKEIPKELDTPQEKALWAAVGENYVEAIAKGIYDSDAASDEAKEKSQEILDRAEEILDIQESFGELSAEQELKYWKEIRKIAGLQGEELLEIDKTIAEKEAEILEEQQEAQEEFLDSYRDRVDELSGFADIFEDFETESVSGRDLKANLISQIRALEDYSEAIENLASRGISTELLNELKDQGVDAVAEIQALAAMTDEELARYNELYAEKMELAARQAALEISGATGVVVEDISEQAAAVIEKASETVADQMESATGVTMDDVSKTVQAIQENAQIAIEQQKNEQQTFMETVAAKVAEYVGAALLSGLTGIQDTILSAMPENLNLLLDGKQVASTLWSPLEGEGDRRNRIFAPSRQQIANIALSVGGKWGGNG